MKLQKRALAGLISAFMAVALVLGSGLTASAYPTGTGQVGKLWGVVTGFESGILITARGVAELDGQLLRNQTLQIRVTNPSGFSRNLLKVRTNSNGEYLFRVGGLKWQSGTYKLTVTSGDESNTLAVFVSSKRVRG